MSENRLNCAITGLQWTLGLVILIEATLFVMPSTRQSFTRTHLPDALRLFLGWGEIVSAVLLLIPVTVVRGAWLLIGLCTFAILVHLLHGLYNVGNLGIYAAAAWTVAAAHQK